jgi:hypothetical protein
MVAMIIAALAASSATLAAAPKRELTPADAIATTRIMENQATPGDPIDDASLSPDGRRYVLRIARGDLARNGVWVDLLTAPMDSLASASRPKTCAHLFTTGYGSLTEPQAADYDPHPSNELRWLNNREVAFLWTDPQGIRQVISVDLTYCKSRFLTHSHTPVYAFATGPAGALLFNAKVSAGPSKASRLWAQGFTVSDSSDGLSILRGDIGPSNITTIALDNQWFLRQSSGPLRHIDILGSAVDHTNPAFRGLSGAPNRRFALTHVGLSAIPDDWKRYTHPFLRSLLDDSKSNSGHYPLQYAVIDLQHGTARTLWNAPSGPQSRVPFSPQSDAVLLAPTFLPVAANSFSGLAGNAAAEVNVVTGDYKVLPIDLTGRTVTHIAWTSATTVEIQSTDVHAAEPRTERFQKMASGWETLSADAARPDSPTHPAQIIHLETRQSLNSPPRVFAVDSSSGDSRLILDLNPGLLEHFKLGRVERVSGTLSTGQPWLGQLIYPADYVPGKKCPLVIQTTYGKPWGVEEFSLDGSWGGSGMGLGPSAYADYPGQLLATRNIAVLHLEVLHLSPGTKEAPGMQLALETVAQQLSASGLVDENKIGLDGFSRNGYWVEYTLAHTEYPFAAAIASDNYDPSYLQSALSNWRAADAQVTGAPAFGAGLNDWLTRAPGFNAEHMHTPLLMIGKSSGTPYIIAHWEIYSRLRHLNKPVDMYLMPYADRHPSHTPQNPRQIVAVQEGALDWFSFWLTGREDPNPAKREQYDRWHRFRLAQSTNTPGVIPILGPTVTRAALPALRPAVTP